MKDDNTVAKYPFTWCKDCGGLKGCFYQHGEYSGHPYFLDPDCTEGPMPKEEP